MVSQEIIDSIDFTCLSIYLVQDLMQPKGLQSPRISFLGRHKNDRRTVIKGTISLYPEYESVPCFLFTPIIC